MIVLPVRNIGLHIIEKLIDQLQLQFFLVSLIVGEKLPETVEKMTHSNEIQLCLILFKQPQLLHFFLHKNNGIPDVKGGRRETAEESYIFSVIIEALIHVSDGTGLHSQKIGHRKIFKPDSFRETKSVKQISVNELDPWVWRNRR